MRSIQQRRSTCIKGCIVLQTQNKISFKTYSERIATVYAAPLLIQQHFIHQQQRSTSLASVPIGDFLQGLGYYF